MKQIRIFLAMCGALFLLLIIAGACYWRSIARCVVLGVAESRSIDLRFAVVESDEVEVLLLKDNWEKPATSGVYIAPYEKYFEIIDSKEVDSEHAKKIAHLWSMQVCDPMIQALCHDPAYGLRFKKDGKLLWETSICFKCNNFTLPVGPFHQMTGFMGFDSRTDEAKELLKILQESLPRINDG